jgi:nitroreductase
MIAIEGAIFYDGSHGMAILEEILNRRTIESFEPSAVEKSKLERVLEAGRLAPSAKNRQEWRFVVIRKKALREKAREAAFGDERVVQAPVVIAVCTTNVEYVMPNGQPAYPVDLGISAAYMSLQAVREGLGTSFLTTFDEPKLRELLTVPHSMRVVLLLLLGRPADLPEPRPRKPLGSIVSYDHW